MKSRSAFAFVLLLPVSIALAQTKSHPESDVPTGDLPQSVAVARCVYTPKDGACASTNQASQGTQDPSGNRTLAQLAPRMRGPMAPPPMGQAAYPGMSMSQPSPAHLLIGALIGFGVGAALAARGNVGARGILGFGTVGAGIGAGMVLSVPTFPVRRMYRHRWPDDDEEALRSKPRSSRREGSRRTATPKPDPPQPAAHASDAQQIVAEAP